MQGKRSLTGRDSTEADLAINIRKATSIGELSDTWPVGLPDFARIETDRLVYRGNCS